MSNRCLVSFIEVGLVWNAGGGDRTKQSPEQYFFTELQSIVSQIKSQSCKILQACKILQLKLLQRRNKETETETGTNRPLRESNPQYLDNVNNGREREG